MDANDRFRVKSVLFCLYCFKIMKKNISTWNPINKITMEKMIDEAVKNTNISFLTGTYTNIEIEEMAEYTNIEIEEMAEEIFTILKNNCNISKNTFCKDDKSIKSSPVFVTNENTIVGVILEMGINNNNINDDTWGKCYALLQATLYVAYHYFHSIYLSTKNTITKETITVVCDNKAKQINNLNHDCIELRF